MGVDRMIMRDKCVTNRSRVPWKGLRKDVGMTMKGERGQGPGTF